MDSTLCPPCSITFHFCKDNIQSAALAVFHAYRRQHISQGVYVSVRPQQTLTDYPDNTWSNIGSYESRKCFMDSKDSSL
jgi:hypothetical protein